MNEFESSYYSVIPATVRYDDRLKFGERILYAEISSLTTRKGYCFAQNRYFAKLFNVSLETISRWISHLKLCGYIDVDVIRNEKNEVDERRIYIIDISKNTYCQNNQYPYCQNRQEGIDENVKDNNINIKIDRLNIYILNRKGKIPDELKNVNIGELLTFLNSFEMLYTNEVLSLYAENNIKKVKYIVYALVELFKTRDKFNLSKLSRNKLIEIYNKCEQRKNEIIVFYDYFYACIINELNKP